MIQRLGLQDEEKKLKAELIDIMHDLGLEIYETTTTDETLVIECNKKEKLTVTKKGEDDE